jgi:hypothetical protein
VVLDLLVVVRAIYRNLAWLYRFRNLPHQVDLQEPSFERRVLNLDVIGQIERTKGNGGLEIFLAFPNSLRAWV